MKWDVKYLPEAERDFADLARNQQLVVRKAIAKVQENPLPASEGGYGKPLGNRHDRNLTGFLKVKLLHEGIRVVYQLVRTETQMLVIVIGVRADEEVYELAAKRKRKYQL